MLGAGKGIEVVTEEAFRLEFFRMAVPGRISVKAVCAREYQGGTRYGAALVDDLFGGGVRSSEAEDGAISVEFLNEGSDVGEVGLVFPSRQTRMSNNLVNFCGECQYMGDVLPRLIMAMHTHLLEPSSEPRGSKP